MSYPSAVQMTMDLLEAKSHIKNGKVRNNYRNSDPNTSKLAGERALIRAGSQRHSLLLVYMNEANKHEFPQRGLTDEEAGNLSGLSKKPKCCYWKRCSELRMLDLIMPNGEHRLSSANEKQMVCILTKRGLDLLKSMYGVKE